MNLTRVAADDGGVALGTALSLADAKHHLNALHLSLIHISEPTRH